MGLKDIVGHGHPGLNMDETTEHRIDTMETRTTDSGRRDDDSVNNK